MKKIIFGFLLVTAMASCGTPEKTDKSNNETVAEVTPEILFAKIIELDQKLVNKDLSFNVKFAKEIYNAGTSFAEKYPTHEKTEDAIEFAVKGAEGIGKYDEAINLLHKLITEFDESDKTPIYMYNKARILEERLGKKENAKAAYKALIERFPENPLSISAQEYLNMDYINMTDAEIIEFLISKNQESE